MELVTHKKLYLVSGRATRPLAEAIASELGEALGEPNIAEFANGEIHCRFSESIRGCDVFIIQTHCHVDGSSINDTLICLLYTSDAADDLLCVDLGGRRSTHPYRLIRDVARAV